MWSVRPLCRQVPRWTQIRSLFTLDGHPHIYVFPNNGSHMLSLLPSEPPSADLCIGITSKLPPTTDSFRENPSFLETLQEVISQHGHEDPDALSQAHVMASMSGANIASGGVLMPGSRPRKRRGDVDFGSGASGQGGAGSAGRGGWIHLSDSRRPPEYGRIAWPEDIFGSLEVDGYGKFVGGTGNYQASGIVVIPIETMMILIKPGTYRIVTRDGILGLSPFLREKLVQKLREQESQ